MRAVIHWSTRKKKPLQKRTSPWQEFPLLPRVLCGRLCNGLKALRKPYSKWLFMNGIQLLAYLVKVTI